MKKKKRNILLSILIGAFLLCAVAGGTFYYYLFAPQFHPSKTVYIYVDRDDTADSIYHKIKEFGHVNKFTGFQWMAKYKDFNQNIHTGRYAIQASGQPSAKHGETMMNWYMKMPFSKSCSNLPMPFQIGYPDTPQTFWNRLARSIGKVYSAEMGLFDSTFLAQMGYTNILLDRNLQVYWDMSVDEFFKRIKDEHKRFWNKDRLSQATAIGMTPEEVSTLASIVEEETNNNEEKPM